MVFGICSKQMACRHLPHLPQELQHKGQNLLFASLLLAFHPIPANNSSQYSCKWVHDHGDYKLLNKVNQCQEYPTKMPACLYR